jgi:hypothetical protein
MTTRRISHAMIVGCLFAGVACDESNPVGPTVQLNQQFTLAPGQSAAVEGTPLRIEFLQVSGDSRCPADALCIQRGDAVVRLRASASTTADYELHTSDDDRALVTHAGYRIGLAQLQPYPFSSRVIDPDAYRATLAVSR